RPPLGPRKPGIPDREGAMSPRLGKSEDAARCLEPVLEKDPNHYGALAVKGVALVRAGRAADALLVLDRAILGDTENGGLYLEREGPLPRPSPEVRRGGEVLRPRALDRSELRGRGRREEAVRGAGRDRDGGGVRAGRRAVRAGGAAPGKQGGDLQGMRGAAAALGQ